jgi:hypothetical protein
MKRALQSKQDVALECVFVAVLSLANHHIMWPVAKDIGVSVR